MKNIALLLVLLTAGGCSFTPQVSTTNPSVATAPQPSSSVTFKKLYAGGQATCGALYTTIEGLYKAGKISKQEATELKLKVDGARQQLDEAYKLYLTNTPNTANAALSYALSVIEAVRAALAQRERIIVA